MDGYQLSALHVLMDTALLVHMLRTGAVQYLRQAKASSTCPESLWETFGVWVFVCSIFWICVLSNLVGQWWLKSKSFGNKQKWWCVSTSTTSGDVCESVVMMSYAVVIACASTHSAVTNKYPWGLDLPTKLGSP